MTSSATTPTLKRNNTIPATAFAVLVIATISLFLIPAIIIRPFAYQAPNALKLAMAIRSAAPLWTALTAFFTLILAVLLWKRIRVWAKIVIALATVLACGSAVMARIDYFEWMFHPVPSVGFESASATKLDPSQMVMAVRVSADSRAYPIRAMAYHHIVNDIVGAVPIAVTY
jgi:uncharacterized protein DUF3179